MGIVAGFLFYVSRGLSSVNLREAFNHQVPPAPRATLNSLSSAAFRVSFAAVGPLIGIAVDACFSVRDRLRGAGSSASTPAGRGVTKLAPTLARGVLSAVNAG